MKFKKKKEEINVGFRISNQSCLPIVTSVTERKWMLDVQYVCV